MCNLLVVGFKQYVRICILKEYGIILLSRGRPMIQVHSTVLSIKGISSDGLTNYSLSWAIQLFHNHKDNLFFHDMTATIFNTLYYICVNEKRNKL